MHIARAWPAVLLLLPAVLLVPRTTGGAAELQLGPRRELTHPGKGHEVHASAPALAVTSDGTPLVTWATEEGQDKHVYVARMVKGSADFVLVLEDKRDWDNADHLAGLSLDRARLCIEQLAGLHAWSSEGGNATVLEAFPSIDTPDGPRPACPRVRAGLGYLP